MSHHPRLITLLHRLRRASATWYGRCLTLLPVAFVVFLAIDTLAPFPMTVPYARVVTDREGAVLTSMLSSDEQWRFETRVDDVAPVLREAFIAKEDRWFRWHPGINPFAALRAAVNNVVTGTRTSGASTITMQVARLLERRPRTLTSKLVESFRALQLEWHYSKDEILAMYMTLVPYGGNVEGVTAASVLYFRKPPSRLTVAEAVALTIIPNRPTSLRLGPDNPAIVVERNRWLRRLANEGFVAADLLDDALHEPLVATRQPTPRAAWHLSVRLLNEARTTSTIRSTLHRAIQEQCEVLTANHIRRLRSVGITNAAVIVIDNQRRDVVAYVGSADPADVDARGQVDGVRAVRSPGSTLKPLVYALAIDHGLMTPRTALDDVPLNIDGYKPENFDQRFRGSVTMEDALVHSLNIPAVSTLARLGLPSFTDALERARVTDVRRRRSSMGLSAVLGGCGVRLEELAGLYAAFADSGRWRPLRWTADAPTDTTATPIVSAGSAYMIGDCLTRLARPDLPAGSERATRIPRIAWKTGTSYGRRDAWAVGYNKRFTIGVWVGNFDGSGVPELTGKTCATPLLFDIVNTIDRDAGSDTWLQRPAPVDVRLVCSVTGMVPGDSCSAQVADLYLPGISPSVPCDHMQAIYVSTDATIRYCTSCLPNHGWTRRWYHNYRPALLAYYRTERIAVRLPPPHDPGCTRVMDDTPITITEPTDNHTYVVERETEPRLRASAIVPADAATIYWFVNDAFVASGLPATPVFLEPVRGTNSITCMDDKGRSRTIQVHVRYW